MRYLLYVLKLAKPNVDWSHHREHVVQFRFAWASQAPQASPAPRPRPDRAAYAGRPLEKFITLVGFWSSYLSTNDWQRIVNLYSHSELLVHISG